MHMKRRGSCAMLYRSAWVPKGTNGSTRSNTTPDFWRQPFRGRRVPAGRPQRNHLKGNMAERTPSLKIT